MPNDTKNRILIEHLINDRTTELMPHDLNEMLDRELSKPAEEVDTQLVQELLELLEAEAPTQQAKEECWKAIQTRTRKRGRAGCSTLLRRMCAAAAALVVIVFVSFGTAKAFNWTFLLKLLGPAMQTFGIYSTNDPVNHADANNRQEYADEFTDCEQVNFAALEDMPTTLKGYTIVPGWIPERYTFATGSIYEDEDICIATLFFQNGDTDLSISISFFENDADSTAYVFESYIEDEHNFQVDGQSVTYFHNNAGEIHAASAISQNAHVYIGGNISEHELEQIIASMH